MSVLAAVIAMALFAGTMTLMFHPLLKFLKLSEVPAALLVCAAGRSFRRRLRFILRSRRQVYLDDIAGVPAGPALAVLVWNLAVARVRRRLAFAWRHGPLVHPPREKTLATELRRPPVAGTLLTAGAITAAQIVAGAATAGPPRFPVPGAADVARALAAHQGSVSARGPRPATVHEITDRDYNRRIELEMWPDQQGSTIHDGHGRFR